MPEHRVPTRHPHGIALPGRLTFRRPPAAEAGALADPVSTLAKQKLPVGQVLSAAISVCRVGVPTSWITGGDDTRPARADELLRHLVADDTTRESKDQAWRHIITQVRDDSDNRKDWNLYALGVAAPGLLARAARLHVPNEGDDSSERTARAQYKLIYAFLERMQGTVTTAAGHTRWRLDIDRPNVYSRLLGGAYDHASGRTEHRRKQYTRRADETAAEHQDRVARLKEEDPREVPVGDVDEINRLNQEGRVRPHPSGIDAAVARLDEFIEQSARMSPEYRIDPTSAELIRRTYIGGEPLGHVAAELNLSQSNASKRRTTAVRRLRRVIAESQRPSRQEQAS
ncbi:hypothetical protein AB0B69_04500 [Micromonospora parva]|uniref:hypothetical protein n=1 Tax=Micromonospora parva TaxID=1464048 RepID=UPI0033C22B58